MSSSGEVWTLYAGEQLVARLVVTGADFPWLAARIEPQPAFEPFRPLFARQRAATEAEEWDRADELHGRVGRELSLVDPKGVRVAEFLLHVDGDDAWWRWSYEPFEPGRA
jgi:hypothetical protein